MTRLAAVSLLSAAAIGLEILLMRMFSIEQWHHFAYLIISIALLGYGASGTFLCFARKRLLARFPAAFAALAGLFGITAPASFALAALVPLNTLEIVWDGTQQLYLLAVYGLLATPFFFAASAIGLTLARGEVFRVYMSDLVGAGLGAFAIIAALFVLTPARALLAIGALGFLAAALGSWDRSLRRPVTAVLVLAALVLPAVWPLGWAVPHPSPYKELSLALRIPGTQVIAELSSPLGLLSVVRSPTVPFRHAPGLSLAADATPPEQLGVFTDGGAMTAITRYDGNPGPIAYLDYQSAALPYHLLESPRVLILGAGGGADVLLSRLHGARTIDAVELNPQMVDLVQSDFAEFAGGIYTSPGTRVHVAEARSFVAATDRRFDLIQVALLDSFSAAAAGMHALNENTLYTVEAFQGYLERLAPGGILAITRWLKLPPRDSLKLFATAIEALERRGIEDPGRRLVLIRSWRTTTLLVRNGAFAAEDMARVRVFLRDRSFDAAFLPGMEDWEANRYNVLDEPYLFEGARALLGPGRERFLEDYKYDVAPATDDRPYFFHFLKWRGLAEALSMGGGGLALVEWGYLILLAALVQGAAASAVLILLPLAARRLGKPGLDVAVYFLGLGFAFLFIEIAFIQKFVLFLGHPLYAVAVVLSAFLVSAGLGSGFAPRLERRHGGGAIPIAVTGIGAVAALYLVGLPPLLGWLAPLPQAFKVAAALGLVAPLGFFMGMPFPLGLARVQARSPDLVPWAWGINGCASVISAVLATLLAVHLGFTVVVILAVGLYITAALAFR